MQLQYNFNEKTKLSDWWKQIKSLFEHVETSFNEEAQSRQSADSTIEERFTEETGALSERIGEEERASRERDNTISTKLASLEKNVSDEISHRQTADNKIFGQLDSIKVQNKTEDLYGKIHTLELRKPLEPVTSKPYFYADNQYHGETLSVDINLDGLLYVDGVPMENELYVDNLYFPVSGDTYIVVRYNYADNTCSFAAQTAAEASRIEGDVWTFTLCHIYDINLEFKTDSSSPTGDRYEYSYSTRECVEPNEDESGAQYVISQTTEPHTLADLQTQDKSSFLAAVNELKQSAYTHPSSHPASMIVQDSTRRFVTEAEKTTWNGKASAEELAEVKLNVNNMMSDLAPPATLTIASSETVKGAFCDFQCTGTDDHLVIQQAIDALPECGGKIVLSEGTYDIGATITISKNNVTLEGMGIGATKLVTNKSNNGIEISARYADISRLSMEGSFRPHGIIGSIGCAFAHIHDLSISGADCDCGIALHGGQYAFDSVDNVYIQGVKVGIKCAGGNNKIHDCTIAECKTTGIDVITHVTIVYNSIYNNRCYGSPVNISVAADNNSISGNILTQSSGQKSISVTGSDNLIANNMLFGTECEDSGQNNTLVNNKV